MTPNAPPEELRRSLDEFIAFRRNHLVGDEKGEAQVFLDRLFKALGHDGVFEAGATLEMRVARRDNGGTAFADLVWKPRVLIEMKKAGQDLRRHYRQAFEYWIDLVPDRPKFVVLCNFDEVWVYDLNLQLEEPVDRLTLDDLPRRWEALAFMLPIEQRPQFENDLVAVTRESAATVARVFNHLVDRGVERPLAQRFILQCVMAMFAEDIGLLPGHVFGRAVEDCAQGASAYDVIFGLFREMNSPGLTPGGRYAATPYFNGGLFEVIEPFELDAVELHALFTASREDWAAVRPEIFGTLFEQSLEMEERHAYGAHFTSEVDIQKVVLPTIVRPWRAKIDAASTVAELNSVADDLLRFRVLDPACGCGNFLYVAYRELRRLEHAVFEKLRGRRRSAMAEQTQLAFVSPGQFYGIDINGFAVEIGKVTLMLARKLAADELGDERQVLPLDDLDDNFQAADALQVEWPQFDACIGNPPYLGRRSIIEDRGAAYSAWLAREFPGVSGVSDYVVYWFQRAHDLAPKGGRVGLVGTNTVRQGDTRRASLDYIIDNGGVIYDAVSSQPWSGDAAVSVSIVNWAKGIKPKPRTLWLSNGTTKLELDFIPGSLSPATDLRHAKNLRVNQLPKIHFQGQTPGNTEAFVLAPEQAENLTTTDPASRAVVHPYLIGDDLIHRFGPSRYVIDFDSSDVMLAEAQAPGALARLRRHALPERQRMAEREVERNAEVLAANPGAHVNRHHRQFLERWWQMKYRREDLITRLQELDRYIALSRVSSELRVSIFSFVHPSVRPSDAVQVFALDDDYSFGILQSHLHRVWFEERCSTFETRLRYTSERVFNSFPWPQAPDEVGVRRVVSAVTDLLAFREERVQEGIPLGRQYNSLRDPGHSPLRDLHSALDDAVVVIYGFNPEEDLLAQLLALNESTALEEAEGKTPRGPGNRGLHGTYKTDFMIEPPTDWIRAESSRP